MDIGMIGLGRMGASMAQRLARHGHHVTGQDPSAEARVRAEAEGLGSVADLAALVAAQSPPWVLWLMVPAGPPVDDTLERLLPLLTPGDTVIDGGNSNYRDSQRRAARLAAAGLHYLDCGTSGGIWGLAEGYSLMIGGDKAVVDRLRPIFAALAPAPDQGWGHVGPPGAGHFVKMVHNGIEYGMMQAYAEGFSVLHHKTEFALDVHQVAQIWGKGSVVRSWLLELIARALADDPQMEALGPWVEDSGEGRWTAAAAIELDVPAPVITLALIERLRSRDPQSFSDKLLASMRHQFGGHPVRKP